MKRIQTMVDVQALEKEEHLPSYYKREIKDQFLLYYDFEGEGEAMESFSLPIHNCIYLLEDEEDGKMILDQLMKIEFVDIEGSAERRYFRIGIMHDHQMSTLYCLEGVLSDELEKYLVSKGEIHV